MGLLSRRGSSDAEALISIAILAVCGIIWLISAMTPVDTKALRAAANQYARSNGGDVESMMCSYDREDRELECMFKKGDMSVSIECAEYGCGGPTCGID